MVRQRGLKGPLYPIKIRVLQGPRIRQKVAPVVPEPAQFGNKMVHDVGSGYFGIFRSEPLAPREECAESCRVNANRMRNVVGRDWSLVGE